MIELGTIFLSTLFLSVGLTLLRHHLYELAHNSFFLLNTLLDAHENEDQKQKVLVQGLRKVLIILNKAILGLLTVFFVAALPLAIRVYTEGTPWFPESFSVSYVLLAMLGGCFPFFYLAYIPKKEPYSKAAMSLHKIALDHYAVSNLVFSWEERLYRKKLRSSGQPFVIVSGLPRSGTSIMTRLLYATGDFHSLQYAHMPFLLCPNFWGMIHRKTKITTRERYHQDGLKIDLDTIEAFEEYFFKVFTRDHFIRKNSLIEHKLDDKTINSYQNYRNLLRNKRHSTTLYLAKNNHLLLRYQFLHSHAPEMLSIFMFRDPVEQANSLLRQHQIFCSLQNEFPFSKEYMDWLGHHEFGLGFKKMKFFESSFHSSHPMNSLEFWLSYWHYYYSHFLRIWDRKKTFLVHHEDLRTKPQALLKIIGDRIDRILTIHSLPQSDSSPYTPIVPSQPKLMNEVRQLYDRLMQERIIV